MSRCLPFSAVAYANRGSNQEALIKLQKEKDEKSERRKEKDLKKKSKKEHKHKETKTSKVDAYDKSKKLSNEKKDPQRKSKLYLDSQSPLESVGCKSEQLEKSDITEEHDVPSCSGSTCNFLESVDSNNKRKREEVAAYTETNKRRNILRIRLPVKEPNVSNASAIEQPKTIPSKGSETCVQERNEEHISHSKIESKTLVNEQPSLIKPYLELPLSTSEVKPSKSSKRSKRRTLIEDWVPEVPSSLWLGQSESEDEDWLFGSKSQQYGLEEPKRLKSGDEVTCSRSATLWPQSMRLPEVDIFALPYTIPY